MSAQRERAVAQRRVANRAAVRRGVAVPQEPLPQPRAVQGDL